jgi:hypothetical protein
MIASRPPSLLGQDRSRPGLLLAIALGVAGCGSSGGAKSTTTDGAANCPASLSPGASMSWQDDGAPQCATIVSATYEAGSASTIFSVIGSEASGIGVGFGVETTTGGLTIDGSYACGAAGSFIGTFNYQEGSTPAFAAICSLTVHSADGAGGIPATGTFSATVMQSGGSTKTISNGVFTVPVDVVGG